MDRWDPGRVTWIGIVGKEEWQIDRRNLKSVSRKRRSTELDDQSKTHQLGRRSYQASSYKRVRWQRYCLQQLQVKWIASYGKPKMGGCEDFVVHETRRRTISIIIKSVASELRRGGGGWGRERHTSFVYNIPCQKFLWWQNVWPWRAFESSVHLLQLNL